MLPPTPESIKDRRRLLSEASAARARGRNGRAILLYRQGLAEDDQDIEIGLRLAQLLALEGERFEAWRLYRCAGKMLLRQRHFDHCLMVFRDATRTLPFEFEAWRIRAELEVKMGREEDAFQTLLEGRRHFRSRFDRAAAIELSNLARGIVPWDHPLVMDLAGLYAGRGQLGRAMQLLEGLALHSEGRTLCAVRWRQWQLSLSLRALLEWMRVCLAVVKRDEAPGRATLHRASTPTWRVR